MATSDTPAQAVVRGLPDDGVLISVTFANLTVQSLRIVRNNLEPDLAVGPEPGGSVVYAPPGVGLADIASVHITSDSDTALDGSVVLDVLHLDRRIKSPAIPIKSPAQKGERKILEIETDRLDRRAELIAHLTANRVYYSNIIHRNLDSGTVVAMLAEYEWNGKPLIDQVEPRPIAVAGNYLVFRAPVDLGDDSGVFTDGHQHTWDELLRDRKIKPGVQPANTRLIPLPTAGVFAEAVLGRSNSAEELDCKRFWRWQDSPIPLTPPEIAPVDTGSRAMSEDLKPGQLGQPVLNITNPTSLPDPTGVGAVLGAIATSNMFRDMSGLAGTQGLVQAGMHETTQAATDAGQLASANMRTEAQKSVAMAQVAADIIKSIYGGGKGGGGGGGSAGISGAGAMINHGRDMDQRAAASGSGQGPTNLGSSKSPASGNQETGSRSTSAGNGGGNGSSNEGAAFRETVHGPLGASGIDAAQAAAHLTEAAGDDSELHLTPVGDTLYAGQAITLKQQVGRVGEVVMAKHLLSKGFVVFWDPRKSVAGPGSDMLALDIRTKNPTLDQLWILDNKAQFKNITDAPALTRGSVEASARELLEWWPDKEHASRALKQLDTPGQPNVRRVVSNAWAGEATEFTKAVFEKGRASGPGPSGKGLTVYDVRFPDAELFETHEAWQNAISPPNPALPVRDV